MLVRDVMTVQPVTVTEDTPIFDAMDLMRRHQFGRLLVTRQHELVGIVTELDLVRVAPSAATTLSVWEQNALLEKMRVREVMTRRPVTISPDDTVEEAARVMCERNISGLPVVAAGEVVGIVTESDLFRALIKMMHGTAPGARLTICVENRVGELANVASLISATGINILAVACTGGENGKSDIIFKVDTPEPADLIAKLAAAGYHVVHQALGGAPAA